MSQFRVSADSWLITWREFYVLSIANSEARISMHTLVAERKAHGIQVPPSRLPTRCVHSQVRLHLQLLDSIRIARWIIWRKNKNKREISFQCKYL
jgi:hypothetical protein